MSTHVLAERNLEINVLLVSIVGPLTVENDNFYDHVKKKEEAIRWLSSAKQRKWTMTAVIG